MERASRLESTRRNLRLARYGVAAAATAAFAGLAVVARVAHAGGNSATSSPSAVVSDGTAPTGDDSQSESFGDFGNSSIGPSSGGAPSVQSGGS
jgi:hypothetical protein